MTFYEKMRTACLAIPQGRVVWSDRSAVRKAKELSAGGIPAFRVVNGKGELGSAIHFHIPGLQKTLLEEDGIAVFWNGHNWCVDLKKYGWMNFTLV